MTRAREIVLIAAAALVSAASAGAHHPAPRTMVPRLDPLDRRLAGVTVQLQHTLADQLVVENHSGRVLEVLDDAGQPFIRIGPAGAEGNLGAVAWYRSVSARGALPASGVAATGPRWARVADVPAWGWYERRLHPDAAGGTPASPERWTVPLRLDGLPIAITGRFETVRPGTFASRVTSPAEPLSGVRVSLIPGRVPALYLQNRARRPVVVLGRDGEPFLRIGPDGTSANVRSPTWLASGKAEVTPAASRPEVAGAPLWRRVSTVPRFAWVEVRAAHVTDASPASPTRAIVRSWRVPLERGRERAEITGVVEWLPASPAPPRREEIAPAPRDASPTDAAGPGTSPSRSGA